MQEVSKLWTDLLNDRRCRKEHKVVINGRTYTHAEIVQLNVAGELYPEDTVSVGGTCAREIELTLLNSGDIPKAAMMAVSTRLVVDDQTSEWIPKGFFRINTRQADATQDTLAIQGFDRMVEAEQPFRVQGAWAWPMSMNQVADHIMAQLGWELDDRTVVTDRYTMELPVNGETCRDLLGWIAAASGGNWTITDQGKARLIRLRDAPETSILVEEFGRFIQFGENLIKIGPMDDVTIDNLKDTTYIGTRASQITTPLRHKPISKIALAVSEEAGWEVGDDTGDCLDVYCPDGTLQMANDLLEYLRGYEYQPVMATEALIDPAAEMGDGATIQGVFATIASMDVTMDALYSADIGAPGQSETETEYGVIEGPVTKKFERQGDALRVQITKTEESLTTKIQDTEQHLSTTITETAGGIRKDFEAADAELGRRTTTIEETIDGITVSGEGGITYIKPGAIQANSITGEMIHSGTITADDIQAGSITAGCLNFAVYDQSQTNAQITSQITALKNGLELTVQNNGDNTAATLRLMDGTVELGAANINLTGLVTVDALQTSGGGVTINGDNITAGTIKGNLIDGKGLNIADKFIVDDSGNITIQNCNITLNDSSVKNNMINDDAVTTSKIKDLAITTELIADGAVKARKINARGLHIGSDEHPDQFVVDDWGNVTIGGNVKINGYISWGNVTGTEGLTSDINTAKSDASTAKTNASTAATDVVALATGQYTKSGDTFINGKMISSATIRGGTFQNLDGTGQFKVETNAFSVNFGVGVNESDPLIRLAASTTGSESCGLYSNRLQVIGMKGGGILRMDGVEFITAYSDTKGVQVFANGPWDFSRVKTKGIKASDIDGLSVTAKFG